MGNFGKSLLSLAHTQLVVSLLENPAREGFVNEDAEREKPSTGKGGGFGR